VNYRPENSRRVLHRPGIAGGGENDDHPHQHEPPFADCQPTLSHAEWKLRGSQESTLLRCLIFAKPAPLWQTDRRVEAWRQY
jgi:hypothetical protein